MGLLIEKTPVSKSMLLSRFLFAHDASNLPAWPPLLRILGGNAQVCRVVVLWAE